MKAVSSLEFSSTSAGSGGAANSPIFRPGHEICRRKKIIEGQHQFAKELAMRPVCLRVFVQFLTVIIEMFPLTNLYQKMCLSDIYLLFTVHFPF